MDLLGDLGQEAGDEDGAYRAVVRAVKRREAQALLLARLPSPVGRPDAPCGNRALRPPRALVVPCGGLRRRRAPA